MTTPFLWKVPTNYNEDFNAGYRVCTEHGVRVGAL